ncbi:transcription factor SPEECHLESS-like [Miscanthus floridulus]|uniref:transcription factor SPEECHLESS-like n=1 Tax=Miscanthus floridulus TaxID=154761 RepID=UPI00345A38A7
MGDGLCELVVDDHCKLRHRLSGAEDLFSIIGTTWEERTNGAGDGGGGGSSAAMQAYSQSSTAGAVGARPSGNRRTGDKEKGSAPVQKKHKGSAVTDDAAADEGEAKMSHITVERNRRKQMNEHLAVLRSLMPCFYVKRGDQASIIGGVVDYIKELQQVLRSLETKKHRKAYAEQVLSPRPAGSVSAASPRPLVVKSTPPLSPRVAVPISPRTPTPGSPYKPAAASGAAGTGSCRLPYLAAAAYMAASPVITPTSSSSSYSYDQQQQHYSTQTTTYLPTLDSLVTELAAQAGCRPAAAGLTIPDVKVEFAGPNLVLKTVSHRAPGQALKIIAALESLSLEILHVSVSTVDDTMVHSFTIKIGIECELSAEELVQEIQRTFL